MHEDSSYRTHTKIDTPQNTMQDTSYRRNDKGNTHQIKLDGTH